MRLAAHLCALIITMGLVATGRRLHNCYPKGKVSDLPPRRTHNLPKHSGHSAKKTANPNMDKADLTWMTLGSGDGAVDYAATAVTAPTITTPVTTTPETTTPETTTPEMTTPETITAETTTPETTTTESTTGTIGAPNRCDPSSPRSGACEQSGRFEHFENPNDCRRVFVCVGTEEFEGACGPEFVWCQEQCTCVSLENCPGACQQQ